MMSGVIFGMEELSPVNKFTAFFKVLTRFLLYSNGRGLLKCKISISSSFGSSSRI
jgi:hypothetical protein